MIKPEKAVKDKMRAVSLTAFPGFAVEENARNLIGRLYFQYIPPDERKGGKPMYVTYQDLVQIGIFIVALVRLLYQIFKRRK